MVAVVVLVMVAVVVEGEEVDFSDKRSRVYYSDLIV